MQSFFIYRFVLLNKGKTAAFDSAMHYEYDPAPYVYNSKHQPPSTHARVRTQIDKQRNKQIIIQT